MQVNTNLRGILVGRFLVVLQCLSSSISSPQTESWSGTNSGSLASTCGKTDVVVWEIYIYLSIVQTPVVCGNSILREVAVMITSESRSIYPTTDVLHQAGPPPAPQPGRAFSTTTSAPSARLLHQLLQPWIPGLVTNTVGLSSKSPGHSCIWGSLVKWKTNLKHI